LLLFLWMALMVLRAVFFGSLRVFESGLSCLFFLMIMQKYLKQSIEKQKPPLKREGFFEQFIV